MSKELTRYVDGRVILTDNGNSVWTSDNDDDFQAEFGETIDPEDVDEVIQYLLDNEYLDEGEGIDVVDEDDEFPADDDEYTADPEDEETESVH